MTLLDSLQDRVNVQKELFPLIFHCRIPVNHHVIKKNNRPIFKARGSGKMFLGKSNELRTYENLLVLEMKRQAKIQNITEPYKGPVWVMMLFFFKNFYTKKGEMNLKLGDLSNLYQLPEDCLQESGVIANDSLIMAHDLSRKLHGPETLLEIFVFKHEQSNARPS